MKIPDWKPLLLLSLILYSAGAYTQNNTIDSLQKILLIQSDEKEKTETLNALSEQLLLADSIAGALTAASQALLIAKNNNYKKGEVNAYVAIGNVYIAKHNTGEGRKYFSSAMQICEELDDKDGKADSFFGLAQSYWNDDNYIEAFNNTVAALKLYEATGNKKGLGLSNRSLGAFYSTQQNYPEALRHYQESLKEFEESGSARMVADIITEIGITYFSQEKYTEALKYDSIALKYYTDSDIRVSVGDVLANIANVLEEQGKIAADNGNSKESAIKYASALETYNTCLKLYQELNLHGYGIQSCLLSLGTLNIKLNKFSIARSYLEKSLQAPYTLGQKQRLRDVYNNLFILDSLEGNYKMALKNYGKYILYRDSVVNDKSAKVSATYKMQNENEKKEAIAKAEQEKKDNETKQFRKTQYLIITSLAILILSILVILLIQYRNNKHKQQANLLLQKQKEKIELTLTELKSTQAQLVQSAKMASLGELTAGIAHEIQNPLNFVNNFSEVNRELIEELKSQKEKLKKEQLDELLNDIDTNLEKINHHGKRADAIVKGMLQHSRSSTGIKEPTDINKLADEYLRLSYQGFRAKDSTFNVTVHTDFDPALSSSAKASADDGKINIIPQDIGRVLLNLYNNAFYAVNEKKKLFADSYEPLVAVSTKKIGDKVSISVKDNGNGIPQDIVDKIFQPFFTTKPTGQGTGLGLSLSYDIITAHGGEIKVESKEDKDTMFTIYLPVIN